MQNPVNAKSMKNEITIGNVSFLCLASDDKINFCSKPGKTYFKSNPKYGLYAESRKRQWYFDAKPRML
jgi:protein associated with RNAse G/E